MNGTKFSVEKRTSLANRLRNPDDEVGWRQFFDRYWKIIYNSAIRAGLSDAEAQDVVQETVISVFKQLPDYHRQVKKRTFRNWLLRLTSWRIGDQLRRRQRGFEFRERETRTSTRTDTVERVPDPEGPQVEAVWNDEWGTALLEAAVERVKKTVDPKEYQLFDLHVFKQWPALKLSRELGVNPGRVYLAKFRIGRKIRQEIANLENKLF